MKYKTKKINILSCLEELSSTGLDNENTSSRPYKCETRKYVGIDTFSKINLYYKNLCVDKSANSSHLCTYGNKLAFINDKPQKCDSKLFWQSIIKFINSNKTIKTQKFFFITHHNRLKKTIFQTILDTSSGNKRHFANCCCIKIYHDGKQWKIKMIFQGFPDKDINYFGEKNKETNFGINTIGILHDKFKEFQNLFHEINNKKATLLIVRHGNAFHNSPLKTTGKGFLGTLKNILTRTTDSCLTPLGIYQARQLGILLKKKDEIFKKHTEYIFSASYMNRAQHTMLEIMHGANEKYFATNYKKLYEFERIFLVYALSRLYRIITGQTEFKKNERWMKNVKWQNTLVTLSNHKEFEKKTKEKKFKELIKLTNYVNEELDKHDTSCLEYLEKNINVIKLYPEKKEKFNIRTNKKTVGKISLLLKKNLPPKPLPFAYLFSKHKKDKKDKKEKRETKKRDKVKKYSKKIRKKIKRKRFTKSKWGFLKTRGGTRKHNYKKRNLSRCSKYSLKQWRKTKKK